MIKGLFPDFSLLIVDDEPAWLRSIRLTLERRAGITNILTCRDSREVMPLLAGHDIGIVILDLTMPNVSGEDLLRMISEQFPAVIVIVVSGMNQIETVVKCMKQGAFDYFVKTSEEDRIITGILHAIRLLEAQRENREMSRRFLSATLQHPEAFTEIVTINKAMQAVFQYVETLAPSSQPLLITGESGVGKGLIANIVHRLSGRQGPLVSVNVGGLDDTMFTDTLFGHVRGAFTGADQARSGMVEQASNGTLFLDEVGDLSIASQAKLLRLLQEGDYFPLGSDRPKHLKARVITSTHQDIADKQTQGEFRKDLFYRLRTHHIHMPPLRERKEDLPLLLDYFCDEAARAFHRPKPAVPIELISFLERYDFPGNVRELRSLVLDAVIQSPPEVLSVEYFRKALGNVRGSSEPASHSFGNCFTALNTLPTIHQTVGLLINEAMKRAKGNQSIASRLLGISQPALSKRLKQMQGIAGEEE